MLKEKQEALLMIASRGNNIVPTTMDQKQTAVQMRVAEGQTFGPKVW